MIVTELSDTPSVYATVAMNDDAKDALFAVSMSTPLTVCKTAIITAVATVGFSVGAPGSTEGRNVGSTDGRCVMMEGRGVDGSGVGSNVGIGGTVGVKEMEGAAVVGVADGTGVGNNVGEEEVGSTVGLHVCPGTVGAQVGGYVGAEVGERVVGALVGERVVGVNVGRGEGTAVSTALAR